MVISGRPATCPGFVESKNQLRCVKSSRAHGRRRFRSPYESSVHARPATEPLGIGKGARRDPVQGKIKWDTIPLRSMLPWSLKGQRDLPRDPNCTKKYNLPRTLVDDPLRTPHPTLPERPHTVGGRLYGGPHVQRTPADLDRPCPTDGGPPSEVSRSNEVHSTRADNQQRVPHVNLSHRQSPPQCPAVDDHIRSPTLTFVAINKRGQTKALPVSSAGDRGLLGLVNEASTPMVARDETTEDESTSLPYSEEDIEKVCTSSFSLIKLLRR